MKRILAMILLSALLILPQGAMACTGVYVGRQVSEDGTMLFGKSNDYQNVWGNHVTITQRVENVPGRTMPVDNEATVLAPLPATTFRYTSTPFMDSATAINHLGQDATVCANEYGVTMEMSITAFSNARALAADPLIANGLTEFTAVDLVICQSDTARKAVEVLTGLLDQYGSSEVNIAIIADQQEAWYVEMYSGHQYAAVLLPQDKVCVFGNEFSLEYLSDYEDCVTSPALHSLPEAQGFAAYGREGELNLSSTYAGAEVAADYSHMRTWIGHQLLAPAAHGEDYRLDAVYPLCFAPEGKVSLQDVMELMRNRFEGTDYNPDETGRTDMRVIGTDTALSVHIAQIYPDLAPEMSVVTWECTGPALYGAFVPVSNGAMSISAPYARNQGTEDQMRFDTERYPYYRFKELNTLCVEREDRPVYGDPVRAYWQQVEAHMIRNMEEILRRAAQSEDREAALQMITERCNAMQEAVFEDAGVLLNDVRWLRSVNSNTMKNGRNPETHEVLDELRVLNPMEVGLDPGKYEGM